MNAGVKLATYAHSPLYIHAKVIVADYGTSAAKVFVGSENFSYTSLTENRELGLITSDPGIMMSLNATLTSDFAGGKVYTVPPPMNAVDAGNADTGAAEAGTVDASDDDDAAADAGAADAAVTDASAADAAIADAAASSD